MPIVKKVIIYIIMATAVVLLLLALVWQGDMLSQATRRGDGSSIVGYSILGGLLMVLLSFIIEWKRVLRAFRRQFSLNVYLLAAAFIVLAFSFVPILLWHLRPGIPQGFWLLILQTPLTNNLLSLLGGIMLARGLAANDESTKQAS